MHPFQRILQLDFAYNRCAPMFNKALLQILLVVRFVAAFRVKCLHTSDVLICDGASSAAAITQVFVYLCIPVTHAQLRNSKEDRWLTPYLLLSSAPEK